MEELISVIVPVYNVDVFLNKCIKTIVNQTYKNLEIILVDDGSTDNSGKICDTWKNEDKRIIVIHKKNEGLSATRNIGVEKSIGKYIVFVDSDDYLELDMIENLYKDMIKNNTGITACGIISENFYKKNLKFCENDYIADSEEMIKRMLLKNDIHIGVWAKIYKRELFDNIKFPVGKINEDLAITYMLFDKAKKISHIKLAGYHYMQRAGSIGSSKVTRKNLTIIYYKEDILNFVEKKYPNLKEEAEIFLIESLNKFSLIYKKSKLKNEYKELKLKLKKYKKRILENSKMKISTKIKSLRIIFLGI